MTFEFVHPAKNVLYRTHTNLEQIEEKHMDNKDFDLKGSIIVRPAKEDDAGNLQTYCFTEKSKEEIADELKTDLGAESRTTRLVADSSGYAVGHISVKKHPFDDTVGQINNLAVSGPFRPLGVADHLIKAAEAAASENGITTLEIELAAGEKSVIQRYKDWGFDEKPIVTLQKSLTDEAEETSNEETETETGETDEAPVEQPQLLE